MRILLDTNIFIPLEDSSIDIDHTLAELSRISSGKHQFLVHPATVDDINRDKDENRKLKILARLNKYPKLESPPAFKNEMEEEHLFGVQKKDNDRVDNLILLAIHNNCVHWLITQDQGIHKKSKIIGEQERVLTVAQAIAALSKFNLQESKLYPSIKDVPCHTLDIKNVFFDSLRESYNFDDWFNNKCAKTGRKTWICSEGKEIHAICIYNLEVNPIITLENKGLLGKALKLCTFKVEKRGYKIGELLLKQAFSYAVENKIDYIYLTIEPGKHGLLEELFLDFGFHLFGLDDKGRDNVFVKDFPNTFPRNDDKPLEYAIKYFPKIKICENSVYLIPIKPKYHEILFPELAKQNDMFVDENPSAGNTIKKAYLCNANSRSIKPGDVIFLYRSEDYQAITSYGIVDQFYIESDPEKIIQWVSKRTVYSYKEIEKMAGKDIKIILFRLVAHLMKPLDLHRLKQLDVVSGAIQSITKINKTKARYIINEAELNDSVLSD
ncbi:MAG: N-acetyltransferase [Methylococcaceae bacterium]|nr:N-acetyltransferase [Methylococcaceae bacterium]